MSSPRAPLLALAASAAALALVAVDAHRRASAREGDGAAVLAVARALPGADLAMSGASRHLRFPSLEEPGAAFADGPAVPDADPAGASMAPPAEVYAEIEAARAYAASRARAAAPSRKAKPAGP